MGAQRMNIVFLFSDEHTASAMGNSGHAVVRTPNLDRLAEKSCTFDNVYLQQLAIPAYWTICRNGTGPAVVRRLEVPINDAILTLM